MAVEVCILAFPQTSVSTVFGMHDVFCSVGTDWQLLQGQTPDPAPFRCQVVGLEAGPIQALNGGLIQPHATIAQISHADVVCIPEFVLPLEASPHGLHGELVDWLRRMHETGAILASVCSGALLLAETGLLEGLEITTHWAYAATLQKHYPGLRVCKERVLCQAGEESRLITAGGAASWNDLVLYLVSRFCGPRVAMQTARVHLLQWHGEGQLPYAHLAMGLQHQDALIQRCQQWLAEHYQRPHPVQSMTTLSGLAERTFKRRFRAATGQSPLDYVHHLRIEEAKQMLEAEDDSVEAISVAVGYEDPGFFRRLFRRKTGLSPLDYRRRFRGLARGLGVAGS